jgi:dTDP-glucose 4,6-dehydratase
MNILVAGGAGFIGSNFVELLLEETIHDIIIYDCFTYAGSMKNIDEFLSDDRVTLITGDIRDRSRVDFAMRYADIVVNFAAETHVDNSIASSEEFITTNVVGTMVLADSARENNVKKFIQVSTDEVYGAIKYPYSSVETDTLKPRNPYSASKASADMLLLSYYNTYKFPVAITRCTNNYGKKQYPEKLIPLFISNLMNNRRVPVYGDGLQIRDWIHVSDHCKAILSVMDKGLVGEIYNIGSSNEIKNIDLTKILIREMNKDEDFIKYVVDRLGHDRRYSLNAEKIRNELEWEPTVNFEHGISSTVKWYKENLKELL